MTATSPLSLQFVQRLHNALREEIDYFQILQVVIETAVSHLNHPAITQAAFFESNPEQKTFCATAAAGFDNKFLHRAAHLSTADWPELAATTPVAITDTPLLAFLQPADGQPRLRSALLVPLDNNNQLASVIAWYSPQPDIFGPDAIALGRDFAQFARLIVQTARLFREAQTQARQARAINEIARAINANLDLDMILEIVATELARLVPYTRASLSLSMKYDPEHLLTRPLKGQIVSESSGWFPISARGGGVGWAFTHGQPFLAFDLDQKRQFPFDTDLRQSGIRSYVCLPLIQNNQVVGILNLGSQKPHAFGTHNLPVLEQVTQQLAIAINNARLFDLSRRRVIELDMLNDIGRALASTLNTEKLLEVIYQQTQRVLDANNLYIALYDQATGEIDFAFLMHEGQRQPRVRLKAPNTLTQYIINTGQPLFLQGDLQAQIKALNIEPGGDQPQIWLGVPMLFQEQAIGVISIQHYHNPNAYDRDQLRLLQAVANQAAISLQNARLLADAEQRATKEAARRAVLSAANRAPDLKAMLDATLMEMMSITNLESGWIFLCLHQQNIPEIAVHQGLSPSFVKAEAEAAPKCNICQKIIDRSDGAIINLLRDCPYLPQEIVQTEGLVNHISAAIVHQDNVVGVINLATRSKAVDLSTHLPLLKAIGSEIGAAVINAHLYQTVHREQRKLAAILNDTADLVLVLDEAGKILLVNAATERTLKIQADDVTECPLTDLGIAALVDALTDAQQANASIVREVEITKGCILYASVSPVHDVGWVMVMQDITPLKELDHLRTEWVASVSHDLKNPLALVQLSTDLLAHAGPLNEQQRDILQRVQFGTQRLRALVTDVLDLARLEAGPTLKIQPVNLHQIVANALEAVEEMTRTKGHQISADLPPILPLAQGNEALLVQVLVNLLSNAVKYTPPNGQIKVHASQHGDALQMMVTDTGRGIPDEAIPHLFDRFYRVPGSEIDNEGTGLGLSIVKTIVEKHNGCIHVESQVNLGTTFTVILPIATQ